MLLSLCACRKKDEQTQDTQGATSATSQKETQSAQPSNPINENKTMVSVSVPAKTESVAHSNGTTLFQRTYQDISMILDKPDVADKIILDFLTRVDNTAESAASIEEMAKTAYRGEQNWMPYMHSVLYSPARIDHNVLSFKGSIEEYTGGPHPNRSPVSASYDLQTGDILTLASIMQKDATVNSIRDMVLAKLAEISATTSLYDGYENTVAQRFANDPSTNEDWYFSNGGLCFDFYPYDIAPYSSGIITVEIPYGELGTIIHEDYLPTPRNTPEGTVRFTPIENIDMNSAPESSDVIINNDGKMLIAQTDGYVQNVHILDSSKSTSYIVFATYALYASDGIMIQANDDTLQKLSLTYTTGTQTVTTPIK